MKRQIIFLAILAFFAMTIQGQTVTDIDGNVYNTVTIGTQKWMKENLKAIHYRNGDTIPNIIDGIQWMNLDTGAYCYYDNDSVTYAPLFGALYNWFTVTDSRSLCPTGWHVPDTTEWKTIITYLGGDSVAGGAMKDTGSTYWINNTGATNSSGFTALPGGGRHISNGYFAFFGVLGSFWSKDEIDSANSWHFLLEGIITKAMLVITEKQRGMSIRCICDTLGNSIQDINNNNYGIQIYPNPAIDRVLINIIDRQDMKMKVYNIIGECVLERDLSIGANDIYIGSLSKGIYVLSLSNASLTFQQKLIKE
jgi:uncharacterized protein (TIGR02145 family)